MYAVLGWTDTVWVHWALSLEVTAPARALEPPCTGEETTEPRLPEQDQGEREPDSKPGLDRTLAAWAVPGTARAPARASAAEPSTATRARLERPRKPDEADDER